MIELRYLGRPRIHAPFAWIAANGNLAIFLRTAAAAARWPINLTPPATHALQNPGKIGTGATAAVASRLLAQQPSLVVALDQVRTLALLTCQ